MTIQTLTAEQIDAAFEKIRPSFHDFVLVMQKQFHAIAAATANTPLPENLQSEAHEARDAFDDKFDEQIFALSVLIDPDGVITA